MDRMIDRVRRLMLDHEFHTLDFIATMTGGKLDSVSSLMRQLRDKKHGGFVIEKKYVGDSWVYRIAPPPEIQCKPTPPVEKKPKPVKTKKPPLTDAQKIARAIMENIFSRLTK